MSEPVLRASGRDEDAGIREVIAQAFPDNPKSRADVVAWQYWENPFGSTRTWVWEEGGRIVAHYTGYPVPAVLGGRPAVMAVGVDAAVAPGYQGRGLFKPLSRALYEDCARHGMAAVMCFPNQSSIRGITAAGWVPVGRLRTHVLALDDVWLARRLHAPVALAGVARSLAFGRRPAPPAHRGEEVPGPPDGLQGLWAQAGARTSHGIARGAAWWRWRYGARPDRPYRYFEVRRRGRLEGAAVTTVRDDFGGRFAYVLELLATGPAVAAGLVRALAEGAVADGAAGAALVALPGSSLGHHAGAAGFRRLPVRLEPKALWFGAVPGDAGLAPDEVAWSVAWGDLDHI